MATIFPAGSRVEVALYSPKTGEYELTRKATVTGRYEIGASEEMVHPTSAVDATEPMGANPRWGYLVQFDGYDSSCAFEDARNFKAIQN